MYKKTICLVLIVAMLAAFTAPVMASGPVVDVSHPLYQQYTVTQEEKEKFNPYVLLNEETHQYSIKAEAATALTTAEYQKLQRQIDQTNAFLATVDFDQYGDEIFVIAPEQESPSIALYANGQYVEGVTKIETYWWGYTVYLSKTAAQTAISTGFVVIGSVTVAGPLVLFAIGVLGVATGLALPGGIIFDYNIILSAISPSMLLDIVLCVSSVRYQ
ncbi:MAG: hypothetical protein O0V67_08305 [Methanocorpusculum sp.]|nr:hypothetical protein [Methanocorpusculum sp.]